MIDNHKELLNINVFIFNNLIITFIIMKKCFLIILFIISPNYIFSQSGELLLQQYNKGPSLDNYYSKAEIYIGADIFRMNKNEKTRPIINFGGNIEVIYNLSKTFGIKTGLNYFPVKYFYKNDEKLKDLIKYISIPIGLKLRPTEKSKFSMGINYNDIKKAVFYNENIKGEYNLNEYENTLGFFIGYEYILWKLVGINVKYQFSKENSLDKIIKAEKYKGLMLTIKLKTFSSKIINK